MFIDWIRKDVNTDDLIKYINEVSKLASRGLHASDLGVLMDGSQTTL